MPRRRTGKLKNFTGVDAPYEAPRQPEVHLHTLGRPPDALAAEVLATLIERGIVSSV